MCPDGRHETRPQNKCRSGGPFQSVSSSNQKEDGQLTATGPDGKEAMITAGDEEVTEGCQLSEEGKQNSRGLQNCQGKMRMCLTTLKRWRAVAPTALGTEMSPDHTSKTGQVTTLNSDP